MVTSSFPIPTKKALVNQRKSVVVHVITKKTSQNAIAAIAHWFDTFVIGISDISISRLSIC
jgi:hypothetical protein